MCWLHFQDRSPPMPNPPPSRFKREKWRELLSISARTVLGMRLSDENTVKNQCSKAHPLIEDRLFNVGSTTSRAVHAGIRPVRVRLELFDGLHIPIKVHVRTRIGTHRLGGMQTEHPFRLVCHESSPS